jgi:hypothetical protein
MPMDDAILKREGKVETQLMPTFGTYAEAMNKFSRSARAFMEHVHLLTEARAAYQEAVSIGADLRNRLDAGDQTLQSLMTQLEQIVNVHLSEPVLEKKKPELVKAELIRGRAEANGTDKNFLP